MPVDEFEAALAAEARQTVAANKYLTLSTVDANGRPWVSPVYFTPDGDDRFLWVSSPDATHSVNLAARPEVAFVIFDSTVPIGGGRAVYCSARASAVPDDALDADTAVFVSRFDELGAITVRDVRPPGLLRLYQAIVTQTSVLLRGADPRNSGGVDTRVEVTLTPDV